MDEVQGQDYYFLAENEFEQKKQKGKFVEWAKVHGYYYGTIKEKVESWLDAGRVVFLDLDVNGGLAVKEYYGDAALLIFIKPPSFASLKKRLADRRTETQAQIEKRLQRYPFEMQLAEKYDVILTNVEINETVDGILEVVEQNYVTC